MPTIAIEAWVILAAGVLVLLWYILLPGDGRAQDIVSNLTLTATSGLATLLCVRTADRLHRRDHFWRVLGLACLAWFAGQLVWDVHVIWSIAPAPFPTLADLAYILFYPLCATAFFRVIWRESLPLNIGAIIDGLTVTAVASLFCYEFLVVPLSQRGAGEVIHSWLTIAAQAGIVGLLALGMLTLIWTRDSTLRGPLAVVVAGLFSFAIADVIYTRDGFIGTYEADTILDLWWHLGFLLLGLAAVLASTGEDGILHNHHFRGVRWRRAGMQLSVLAFGVLASYAALRPGSSLVLGIGVLVVAILLVAKLTYAAETEQRLVRSTRERDRLAAEVSAREATQAEMAAALAAQRAANEALARVNQTKSDFVSVVSHEFRTPLTSVQGFADLLKDEELDDAQIKEFAEIIGDNSRRLARMISDMLDLDRLQSGQVVTHRVPINVNAIVAHVADTIGPAAGHHRIHLDLDTSLPVFSGDRDQIIRVVTNLLDNAIKYQPQGGDVDISTSRDGNMLRLRVRDHGVGVPPELLETIFERFVRSPGASQDIKGTGLGLPITRQLVELHGGRIWAELAEGGGTAFHVQLPLNASTPTTGTWDDE